MCQEKCPKLKIDNFSNSNFPVCVCSNRQVARVATVVVVSGKANV